MCIISVFASRLGYPMIGHGYYSAHAALRPFFMSIKQTLRHSNGK